MSATFALSGIQRVVVGCLFLSSVLNVSGQENAGARGGEQLSNEKVEDFVKEHHPELGMLLKRLRRESSGEYRKAVDEIRVVAERVERLSVRQSARAQYEIDRWKIDSQIRLLLARMVSLMGEPIEGNENPGLAPARERLRELAAERVRLDRDRLEREQQSLIERLERVKAQVGRIDSDFDAAVEKQLNTLTRSIDIAAKKRGVSPKRGKVKVSNDENPAASKKPGNKKPSKSVDK